MAITPGHQRTEEGPQREPAGKIQRAHNQREGCQGKRVGFEKPEGDRGKKRVRRGERPKAGAKKSAEEKRILIARGGNKRRV